MKATLNFSVLFVIICFIMFRSSSSFVARAYKSHQSVASLVTRSKPLVNRLFFSGLAGEDTVVSRCTQKISSALNPVKISVTSTNDDPNGNHV